MAVRRVQAWSVYVIQASDMSLYTGITTDLARRFRQHQTASRRAKFFAGRDPVRVVYEECGHDRSSASRREAQIKALSRRAKLAFIAHHQAQETGENGEPAPAAGIEAPAAGIECARGRNRI